MLQQDLTKKPMDFRKTVLLLHLWTYGVIVKIRTKEKGHNSETKPVKKHSDQRKQ
jgi:hypothetical protein